MGKSAMLPLLLSGLLLLCAASARASGGSLLPAGYAFYEEFGEPVFAFELKTPDGSLPTSLADSEQLEKALGIRVLADGVSSRQWCRFWSQNISINRETPVQGEELETLRILCNRIPDLTRGDLIQVYSNGAGSTRILANNEELFSRSGPCLNSLLLAALLGQSPANSSIPKQLQGGSKSELAARAYHQTQIQPGRLTLFAPPVLVADPVAEPPEPVAPTIDAEDSASSSDSTVSPMALLLLPPQPGPTEYEPEDAGVNTQRLADKGTIDTVTQPQEPAAEEVASGQPLDIGPETPSETNSVTEDLVQSEYLVALADYQKQVMSRIYASIRYPQSALLRGQEDVVRMNLRIGQSGDIAELALLEASQYNSLNIEATRAAEQAAPFPQPPELLTAQQLELMIPVNFRLSSN